MDKKRIRLIPIEDEKKTFDKDKQIHAQFGASFHGECWYNCPVCGKAFEFFSAFRNGDRCPHCNQLLYL